MRQLARQLALVACLVLAACGGDDSPAADAPQAGPDAPPVMADADPNACAEPGAAGNELGVGEYCTAGGQQCSDNPNGGGIICPADFGETATFCTRPCSSTSQCGTEATCAGEGFPIDGGQMGCVPNCML